jgi:quercetin dioxygenase-like cupin family protein
MMKVEEKQFGKLRGNLYSFEEVGDTLPMHDHAEGGVHVTFILSGSFRVHGGGWEMVSKAGAFIDWEPGQFHEFIALEPNSRCLNVLKNVQD